MISRLLVPGPGITKASPLNILLFNLVSQPVEDPLIWVFNVRVNRLALARGVTADVAVFKLQLLKLGAVIAPEVASTLTVNGELSPNPYDNSPVQGPEISPSEAVKTPEKLCVFSALVNSTGWILTSELNVRVPDSLSVPEDVNRLVPPK